MELGLETFKKIEVFGWAVAMFIAFFIYWHFFAFIAIAVVIRRIFMVYKTSKLGLLPTEGKSVVVTGCDSGFGLALATRLHKIGFKVFATCLDVKSDGATSLQNLDSDRMKIIPLDVTSDEMVAKALEIVKSECDQTGLWGLVNNSGMNDLGDAEMTTMVQYEKLCNINLFGMIRVCKAFIPLVRQAKGRIVNVTSVKGRVAIHGSAAYTVSKFGAQAFSEVLKQEMRPFGVRVITIEPGKFGGATAIHNEAFVARASANLESMWKQARPEVQLVYGSNHIQSKLEEARISIGTSYLSVDPVIDAEEDALTSTSPLSRYLIDGSNTFIDKSTFLARMVTVLPEALYDRLRDYLCPYTTGK